MSLSLGSQHRQLRLLVYGTGPPELCCVNVRLIHELRQGQSIYFHGAAVRVGNNGSEVTHLVPLQCRHPPESVGGPLWSTMKAWHGGRGINPMGCFFPW